jgi:hypothetical protein
MDWLEQLFGLNPDGGDGSMEALITVAVVALAVAMVMVVSPRARALGRSLIHRVAGRSKTAG